MNPQKIILKSKDGKDFKKRVSKLDTKGKGMQTLRQRCAEGMIH